MAHESISEFLALFLLGWLGALAVIVLIKMLRGDINTTGLMCSAKGPDSNADPERVTLVMLTVGVALYYLVNSIGIPLEELRGANGEFYMPDLPSDALVLLGGSQTAYITGKIFRPKKGV